MRLDGDDVAVVRTNRSVSAVKRLGALDGWTLIETVPGDRPLAIFERFDDLTAPMLWVDADGIAERWTKTAESTDQAIANPCLGHSWQDVIDSPTDLLGRDILSRAGDPDYATIASAFPPIRQLWGDTYNFLGTPDTMDKVWFIYGGRSPNFDPAVFHPPVETVRKAGKVLDGLVGGHLPILRFVYPEADGSLTEMLAFAPFRTINGNLRVQPVWYRVARIEGDQVKWVRYVDSYLPYPPRSDGNARDFYRDLTAMRDRWAVILSPGMAIDIPDQRMADQARHSLIRAMMGRSAGFPKYGVVDKNYGGTEHDGFPDTFTVETEALVEWGLIDRAGEVIDNYFDKFVRDDGTILYRGPETGQFGRMLTVVAAFADRGGSIDLVRRHADRINAIADNLAALWRNARTLPADDPAFGIIAGWSEADAVLESNPMRYMKPYFSNQTEAIRGFNDLARVWQRSGDAVLTAKGVALAGMASEMRVDLDRALERSTMTSAGETSFPTIAGASEPFHVVMQRDKADPQWRSYRSWMEMLHSGILPRDRIDQVVDYRSNHHDVILGMPMVYGYRTYEAGGFLSYGHGYGLVQADRAREAILLTRSLMAHQYTRGMWTAPETRRLAKGEWASAYCGPSQLSCPLLVRWLLAFEEPERDELWLGKAMPADWLAAGQRVKVDGIPTRWGRFGLETRATGRAIVARVTAPDGSLPVVKLRLRQPPGRRLIAVRVDGRPSRAFDAGTNTIDLTIAPGATSTVIARFA